MKNQVAVTLTEQEVKQAMIDFIVKNKVSITGQPDLTFLNGSTTLPSECNTWTHLLISWEQAVKINLDNYKGLGGQGYD